MWYVMWTVLDGSKRYEKFDNLEEARRFLLKLQEYGYDDARLV